MADVHLTLSQGEQELLLRMLNDAQRKKRVEVRRTEFSHEMREELEAEELLIEGLIARLSAGPAAV